MGGGDVKQHFRAENGNCDDRKAKEDAAEERRKKSTPRNWRKRYFLNFPSRLAGGSRFTFHFRRVLRRVRTSTRTHEHIASPSPPPALNSNWQDDEEEEEEEDVDVDVRAAQ